MTKLITFEDILKMNIVVCRFPIEPIIVEVVLFNLQNKTFKKSKKINVFTTAVEISILGKNNSTALLFS